MALVGQGDADLEASARVAADRFRGRVAVRLTLDAPLSRRIYAGSDFFVVPSRFEPCGLTQMYAMDYGAVPIVTDVGGLHDSVEPIDVHEGGGTGIVAPRADVGSLREATLAALAHYGSAHDSRTALRYASARGMVKDFAWSGPARTYQELYVQANRMRRSG